MGYRRRTSAVLTDANTRNSSMKGTNPPVEMDGDLAPAKYDKLIADVEAKLDAYNGTLAIADQQNNEMPALEREMKEFKSRNQAGVNAKYGANTTQYEVTGGVRTSDRKKATKKKP